MPKKTKINKCLFLSEYCCSMSAYEDPSNNSWKFSLELLDSEKNIVEILSYRTYKTYKDAFLDCYGILEYLGFGIVDKNNRAKLCINFWDKKKNTYRSEHIFFDGFDFFKENAEKIERF